MLTCLSCWQIASEVNGIVLTICNIGVTVVGTCDVTVDTSSVTGMILTCLFSSVIRIIFDIFRKIILCFEKINDAINYKL